MSSDNNNYEFCEINYQKCEDGYESCDSEDSTDYYPELFANEIKLKSYCHQEKRYELLIPYDTESNSSSESSEHTEESTDVPTNNSLEQPFDFYFNETTFCKDFCMYMKENHTDLFKEIFHVIGPISMKKWY